jgi:hypothetical protein
MEDSIDDCGSHADKGDLAEPLHAKRIDVRIHLIDKECLEFGDVDIHGHQIVYHMRIDRPAVASVEHRALHERHADTTDHAAYALTVREPGVHHTPDAICAGRATNTDRTNIGVDRDPGEDRIVAPTTDAAIGPPIPLMSVRRDVAKFDNSFWGMDRFLLFSSVRSER